MLQLHQRAALMPNEPGVQWHQFLGSRFATPNGSFAVVVQSITQQSSWHADLKGLIEVSSGASLPVITEFTGVLNLEARDISLHQMHPDKTWSGQISVNGRVMTLRETGQSTQIHLVHEETLAQLI